MSWIDICVPLLPQVKFLEKKNSKKMDFILDLDLLLEPTYRGVQSNGLGHPFWLVILNVKRSSWVNTTQLL